MRLPLTLLCVALIAPTGCAKRDTAYQFRGPGLATVRAPELAPRPHGPQPASELPAGTRIATRERRRATDSGGSHQRATASTTVETTELEEATVTDAPVAEPPARRIERSDRPERAEPTPAPEPAPAMTLADTLRSLVGNRHAKGVTDVDVALNALEALGTHLDDDLAAVTTGAQLVALAEERAAMGDGDTILLGDLILLHDSSADDPVVAVVVGVDDRGTIEVIHLTRRIVRRSFLTLGTPNKKRDADGIVLNTLIRHKEGSVPRGTKYLAGQLFVGHIRLDELVER